MNTRHEPGADDNEKEAEFSVDNLLKELLELNSGLVDCDCRLPDVNYQAAVERMYMADTITADHIEKSLRTLQELKKKFYVQDL